MSTFFLHELKGRTQRSQEAWLAQHGTVKATLQRTRRCCSGEFGAILASASVSTG